MGIDWRSRGFHTWGTPWPLDDFMENPMENPWPLKWMMTGGISGNLHMSSIAATRLNYKGDPDHTHFFEGVQSEATQINHDIQMDHTHLKVSYPYPNESSIYRLDVP